MLNLQCVTTKFVFNKSFKLIISNTIHEVYLFLSLIVQVGNDQGDMLKDYCNILEQFLQPFMEEKWQETDSFIHWHFYTSVTTWINPTKLMKITTDYGKWELHLICWLMHMLSNRVQLNIQQSIKLQKKKKSFGWKSTGCVILKDVHNIWLCIQAKTGNSDCYSDGHMYSCSRNDCINWKCMT